MNRKQMFLFILWIALVVGLIVFAIVYIIIAESKQAPLVDLSFNTLMVSQIFKLLI